jgi:hypothetical protein
MPPAHRRGLTVTSVIPSSSRWSPGILFVVLVVLLVGAWRDLEVYGRCVVGLAAAITGYDYYKVGWKRLELAEGVLVVRDRIRRVRRIPYGAISGITYAKGSVFSLDTDSDGVVWFDAAAAGLDEFAIALRERVLQKRNSVALSGEFWAEQSKATANEQKRLRRSRRLGRRDGAR